VGLKKDLEHVCCSSYSPICSILYIYASVRLLVYTKSHIARVREDKVNDVEADEVHAYILIIQLEEYQIFSNGDICWNSFSITDLMEVVRKVVIKVLESVSADDVTLVAKIDHQLLEKIH